GTSLGDPIEAQALLATYGREHDADRPLWLGSLKSNIGHTQAAAGVAGVIKMVMAMQHGVLPQTLHAETPTTHVDWSTGAIRLLSKPAAWSEERTRRAAVSSFGISGTNAHVILEQAPTAEPATDEAVTDEGPEATFRAFPTMPWVISAKSPEALAEQASRLVRALAARPDTTVNDVAWSLINDRTAFEYRAVVQGMDRSGLLKGLDALARGGAGAGVVQGRVYGGRTAFVFPGQGAQRAGMGADLYRAFPVFADTLDEVCGELDRYLGRSLKELLFAEPDSTESALLDQTAFTQAALFAFGVALYRLVVSLGVEPDYLIGHSIGELAAAHVAGVFSLPDACAVVAARGRLMGDLPAGGGMIAVDASEAEVQHSLLGFEEHLSIAAINGPSSTVVSGDNEAIEQWSQQWRDDGRKTTRLRVSHAFHSVQMDPILEQFGEVVARVSIGTPTIPILSNLSGNLVSVEDLGSVQYWVQHVRRAVRFMDGVRFLEDAGVTRFLELGPGAGSSAMIGRCLRSEQETLQIPAVRPGRPEVETFTAFLAEAFVCGVGVDWGRWFGSVRPARVELPSYAF
ncbi:type I polyketide synthase, partial [Nocardia sp. NPDC005745]|uniref:type I polyketide synthase n=1 Tax=Nocardia sp. NPDC005745 TaxID=3157061 RepID=UPI0033D9C8EC